ncbi:hypothetical protein BH10ACI3_BH10ACI3_04200 [soil metagenome]
MLERSNRSSLIAFGLLIVISGLGFACGGAGTNNAPTTNTPTVKASSTTTPDPCTGTTDGDIEKVIYNAYANDPLLKTQKGHIDVVSKSREVKLLGWGNDQASYDQAIAIAKGTACVAAVDPTGFRNAPPPVGSPEYPKPSGGCATDYVRCGDFCIPKNSGCTISADPGPGVGNSNTGSHGNANH